MFTIKAFSEDPSCITLKAVSNKSGSLATVHRNPAVKLISVPEKNWAHYICSDINHYCENYDDKDDYYTDNSVS